MTWRISFEESSTLIAPKPDIREPSGWFEEWYQGEKERIRGYRREGEATHLTSGLGFRRELLLEHRELQSGEIMPKGFGGYSFGGYGFGGYSFGGYSFDSPSPRRWTENSPRCLVDRPEEAVQGASEVRVVHSIKAMLTRGKTVIQASESGSKNEKMGKSSTSSTQPRIVDDVPLVRTVSPQTPADRLQNPASRDSGRCYECRTVGIVHARLARGRLALQSRGDACITWRGRLPSDSGISFVMHRSAARLSGIPRLELPWACHPQAWLVSAATIESASRLRDSTLDFGQEVLRRDKPDRGEDSVQTAERGGKSAIRESKDEESSEGRPNPVISVQRSISRTGAHAGVLEAG
ncbi:unnamed protein product [Diplocarpon coronariae]